MRHPIRMFISHCFELFSYQTLDQLKRFILSICVLSFHRFVCDSNATGNFENRHCLESEIIKTICYLKIILYIRFKCRYKSFLESSSAIFFQKNLVFCRCTILSYSLNDAISSHEFQMSRIASEISFCSSLSVSLDSSSSCFPSNFFIKYFVKSLNGK